MPCNSRIRWIFTATLRDTQECRRRNIVREINRGDNPKNHINFEELNAQSCMDFEE